MDEPERLVDDRELSPLGRSLLASAATDRPDPSERARVAKRLGVVALTLAGGTEAGSAVAAGALSLWWKAGIVLALLGGIVGITVLTTPRTDEDPVIAVQAPAPAPVPATPRPAPVVEPEPAPVPAPVVEQPVVVEPARPAPVKKAPPRVAPVVVVAPEPVPAPVPAPATIEPAPEPPVPAPVQIDPRRLAAEVAVLDRARTALRTKQAQAALAALDEHRREFHDGALVAEAELVRLEVLVETGQAVAAREQARVFLARFPKSPLVRRVRSLVERLKNQETP